MKTNLASLAATTFLSLTANAQTWAEAGDAGQLTGSYQQTSGSATLTTITGSIGTPQDVDLYHISITDHQAFSATTVGGATFDTVLYLFDLNGVGIASHNDVGATELQSTLTSQWVPGNGNYLLGIAAVGQTPKDALGALMFASSPFTVEHTALPAAGELAQWDLTSSVTGAYSIALTGAGHGRADASVTQVGSGCGAGVAAIYERFTTNNNPCDLAGHVLRGTPTASGRTWTVVPGAVQAIGSVGTPQQLSLADDDKVTVGTLGFTVTSNGVVACDSSVTTAFNPTWQVAAQNFPEALYCWTDLNPSLPASGRVWYEESGSIAQVTFDGVFTYGTTQPNTFQMLFDRQTGFVEIRIDSVAQNHGALMVGYFPEVTVGNPGQTDLSEVVTPVSTTATDNQAIGLESVNGPVIVSTWNQIQVMTTDIPPTAFVHVGVVGTSNPDLPLSVLGLSSACQLLASPDSYALSVFGTTPPADYTWTIATLPPNLALSGFHLYAQSLVFDFGGVFDQEDLASNGLEFVFGF